MAYTTVAKVREKCTLWGSAPPTDNITNFIAQADKRINAVAGQTFTEAQASGSIVEGISTDLAAIYCIAFNTDAFATNAEAVATANFLYEMAMSSLSLLKDERTLNYINTIE